MYQPCDIAVSESHSEEQGGGHMESSHPRAASHQSQQRTDTHTHTVQGQAAAHKPAVAQLLQANTCS